jgi:hypothetical protein
MLFLTSDGHWNQHIDYEELIADFAAHHGATTVYLTARDVVNGNPWDWPSNTDLQTWRAQGHTFGLHPWRLNGSTLTAGFNSVDSWFASTYSVPRSNTVRTHRIEWQGWTDAADIAAAHGIALDTSFITGAVAASRTARGRMATSRQRPAMKFVRVDGTLTSVYQQLTEMADDHMFADTIQTRG